MSEAAINEAIQKTKAEIDDALGWLEDIDWTDSGEGHPVDYTDPDTTAAIAQLVDASLALRVLARFGGSHE